ncbi:MAG: lysophospholipid acyltransferase family protein [Candidatus Zapsychrus exili]|nr:lysophospholipid acyltransferase family protein [Candidatus Zapsychrus exili]
MTYWIVRAFVKFIRIFFFPVKVYGKENIPKKGAFIFASNHKSYIDPMLIPLCHNRRMSFVARDTLFKGFVGWILPKLEAFPIKRATADIGAVKEILKRLKRGMPVLIFPEGTRTLDPSKRVIQPGIGMIAAKTKLPVIPIYIEGLDKVLPPDSKKVNRHPVTVTFGPPKTYSKSQPNEDVSNQIMDQILDLS